MKLTRRKAFGVAVGGAMAGPSVTEEVLKQIPDYIYKGVPVQSDKLSNYPSTAQENLEYLKQKLVEEKNYLIKLINGELNSLWVDVKQYKRDALNKNIESLKSVSNVNKHLIYTWELEKRYIEERIADAKARLPDLIKKIAGL